MKKVVSLYGDSQSHVYEQMSRACAQTLLDMGLQLVVLPMAGNRDFRRQLDDVLKQDVEFAFGWGGAGHALREEPGNETSQSLWQARRLPFIGLYGDSPAYAPDFHRQLGRFNLSLYGFGEHLELRRQLPEINGVLGRIHTFLLDAKPRTAINFDQKKNGKIILLKNGNSVKTLYRFWDAAFNPGTRKHLFALKEIVHKDLANPRPQSVLACVEAYLQEFCFDARDVVRLKLLLISQVDDFLRRIKSELLANVMLDYPTEVRGIGWGHLNSAGRAGKLIEQCDFAASNRLIDSALAIVDMAPNTDSGYHDRFSRAASSFTLCLCNEQQFLYDEYASAASISYAFDSASIAHRIEAVLADPDGSIELGISIAEQFRQRYAMKKELTRWRDLADLVRTNCAIDRPTGAPPYLIWPPTTY